MFQEIVQHTMDAKGRVSLPAKYRNELAASQLVLVEGIEQCLWLFVSEDYDRFVEPLIADEYDETLDELRDIFMAGSCPVEVDTAGRIRVPNEMRTYAGLGKQVALAGKGTRLELWDAPSYAARKANIDRRQAVRNLQAHRRGAQA